MMSRPADMNPAPDAEALYASLLQALRDGIAGREVALIGIHSGGAWIAERLHATSRWRARWARCRRRSTATTTAGAPCRRR